MNEYNKTSMTEGVIYLIVGFVLFFSIIAFYFCAKAGGWWSFLVPFAAAVYGIVTFYKKYIPKKDKEDGQ